MKKRVLSLALAISLCLSLFPTGALAEAFPQEETAAVSQTETPAPAETGEPQTVLAEGGPAAEQDKNTDANESGEETVAADPGADGESDEENTTVEPTVKGEDAEESVTAAPGTDSESGEDSADVEPTTDDEDNENSTTDEPTPDGEKGAESVEGIAAQAADNEIAVFAGENAGPVAEVTTSQSIKTYTDISKAFEAAEETEGANFTVKLLTDVTVNNANKDGIIVPDDRITLDLNGKTIRQKDGLTNALIGLNSSVLYVQSGCTLTIKDSDSEGKGKIVQPNTCPAVAVNGGTVIIEGGTFETTAGTYGEDIWKNDTNCAVYVAGGSATISGGTFTGGPGCKGSLALMGGSTVKLSGGTYVARDANTPSIYNANGSVASLLENNYRFVDGNGSTVSGNEKSITGNVTVKEKGVAYIDKNGKEQSCEKYAVITENIESLEDDEGDLSSGWYVVKNNVALNNAFYVAANATVNLILCNDVKLTGKELGIYSGGTLNIYGQKAGTGKLTLVSTEGNPAISAVDKTSAPATLNIYGGNITATATECEGVSAPVAIGLREGPEETPLNVNIFGGTVTAQAPRGAQAIGVGEWSSGTVTVTVTTADGMKCVKTDDPNTPCAYDNIDGTSVTITKCDPHDWIYTNNNDDTHTKTCRLCRTTDSAEAHTYKNWAPDENGTTHTGTCDCGATTTEDHTTKYTPNADGLTHAAKCAKCNYTGMNEPHTYDLEISSGSYSYKQCACGAFLAAEYNGKQYALLQAAIDAAKDSDGTVKLLQDVGESVTVTDGTVTIDLDNKTWSNNQSGAPLTVNGGSVTLKNGTVQSGTSSRAANGIVLNSGSLTLGRGMAVVGGKMDTTTSYHAVQVNGGNLTLNEYVVLANGLQVPADKTLGDYLPDGMAFMQCTYNPGAVGGSSDYVPEVYTSNAYTGNMRVEAHTHTNIDANGKCVCGLQYAAKITRDNADSFYATLPEAITALADGDTLTLLTDVNAGSGVTINKSVTFDLNGHKLYGVASWLGLLTVNSKTVTVKNGTVESNRSSYYAIHVQGWSTNLTLENVTAQNSKGGGGVIVNQGGLTIESGSYTGMYLNPDVRVTLKGGTFSPDGQKHSIRWYNLGGVLSKDCTDLLADGYAYYDSKTNQQFRTSGDIDTEVTVREGTYTSVAKIGEKEYISLQAALREVKNGETITLSGDLDLGNGAVLLQETTGKNFTIDLNGCTLSSSANYLVFITSDYSGHLTIKNGTLEGTGANEDGLIYVNSSKNPTLTLENVNATGSKKDMPLVGALGGTVEFDGGTYTGGVLIKATGNVVLKSGTFDKGANSYSIKTEITGKVLNDYLDEGSAFWESADSKKTKEISGASTEETLYVKPTPIRSVTAEKAEITTEFGLTENITLKASVAQPEEGGTDLRWYKVENGVEIEIAGANGNTYQLPADLAPNTYHYRLTATKDGYNKSCDFTVTVNKADIANAEIEFTYENCGGSAPRFNPLGTGVWLGTRQSADGSVVKKDYKVTLNGKELTEGTDFTVEEDSDKATDAGPHTLKIAGTGNYARTTSADWEILPYVLKDMSLPSEMKQYDGKPVTLEGSPLDKPEQYFGGDEKYNTDYYIKLAKGADLTITNYSDTFTSVEAGSQGEVTFTVTLKNGNYTFKDADGNDTMSKTYAKSMSIGKSYLTGECKPAVGSLRVANSAAGTYNYDFSQLLKALPDGQSYGSVRYLLYGSNESAPRINLNAGYYTDGVTLDEQTGIMTLPINAVDGTTVGDIGTVEVLVIPNNYGGVYVTINVSTANPVTVSGITASDKVYDGTTDVTLDCSNAAFDGVLGNDTLTVTAKGAFASANAGKQKVVISDLTLGGADADKYILVQNGQQTETTAAITPKDVTVTLTPNGGTYGSVTPAAAKLNGLVAGDDPAITLTYTGSGYDAADVPTHAGRYTVTATLADGNYNLTGTTAAAFVIAPRSIKDAAVVLGQGLVANGKAQTQTVAKVLVDGREIPADAYTVTGNTATAPGSYTLTITAKDGGDYTGSITASYAVAPAPAAQTPGGESGGASGGMSAGSDTKQGGTAQNTPQAGSSAEPSTMTAVPKTADASNPMLYVVLWAAALAGLAATAFAASANKRSGKR